MDIRDRYPIVVTEHKAACQAFWQRYFGLAIVFDSDWFVLLGNEAQGSVVAFMTPDHPSAPPGPQAYSGQGMCLELEVDDAEQALATLQQRGGAAVYPLTREPFGQCRFGVRDPSGLWVDVVEQVTPEDGYWDKYMKAAPTFSESD